MTEAATAHGRRRREAIVDAATELFDRHGFHGTSIDDIGAAAGISGPGLYRHFDSKHALLTAVLDRIWARLRPSIETAGGLPAEPALRLLVDTHVDLAVDDAAALMLLLREVRHVPEWYRRAALRNHDRYVEAWVAPLRELHPGLDPERARAFTVAVYGLIDSAAVHPGLLPADEHRRFLRDTAMDVVRRGPPTAR